MLACAAALSGCPAIVEHPAAPLDDEMASIWRLGLIRMLLLQPHALFARTTVQQWKFGFPGIKPTTLMFGHLNLKEALALCEISGLEKPSTHLIGTTISGEFYTACAKEYPAQLNKGFALAIQARMARWNFSPCVPNHSVEPFGAFLQSLAACTERSEILPDYQPVQ